MAKEIDQMNYHKKVKSKIDYDMNSMNIKLNTMPNEFAMVGDT